MDVMTALSIILSYPHLNTWFLRIGVVAVIGCGVAVFKPQFVFLFNRMCCCLAAGFNAVKQSLRVCNLKEHHPILPTNNRGTELIEGVVDLYDMLHT